MSDGQIEFVRRVGSERRVGDTLAGVSRHWQGQAERFLFVSPHDDDAAIGAGLLIQLAARENVPVHILVVTDGAMGYCSPEQRDSISQIRRDETFAAYEKLGVPASRVIWMGFPDCQLAGFQGRRRAGTGEPETAGFTGLQNALTFHLRQIAPTQVFIPTRADLHPDHRMVHDELMISAFHCVGEIWPELGPPLAEVPYVNEFAVYCDFPAPPSLRIRTPRELLDVKLDAIGRFASQRQIASTVEAIRQAGAEEYHRSVDVQMYHPSKYSQMFDAPSALRSLH